MRKVDVFVLPPTYTVHLWETEVVSMIEQALLAIIHLLFYGLIGVTIINIALIITLVIILSK